MGGDDGIRYQWVIMEGGNDILCESESESSIEDSINSVNASSSSSDIEDATSSTSPSSYGPLYELSELMAQLPIKRGLSKYYQGKSQTFASMASVKSLEDLAKKGRENRRKMKSKSYGGGLHNHNMYSPKATISKKTSRVSLLSSLGRSRRGTLFSSCRTPFSVQKNL